MAVHFNARVYGEVQGSAPFARTNSSGQVESSLTRVIDFPFAGINSFPTDGVQLFPLPNGVLVGGAYVYTVIQLPPSGLNVHGMKYVTDSSVTALAAQIG